MERYNRIKEKALESRLEVYSKRLKKKMIWMRIFGTLLGAIGIAAIFFYYFHIVEPWLCIFLLSYSMGMLFTVNATYQAIVSSYTWASANKIVAYFFYALTLALIIFSFASGNIRI